MATDKYRYHIYPDRIYVIEISKGIKVEIKGSEIASLLGLDSYMDPYQAEDTSTPQIDKRYYL